MWRTKLCQPVRTIFTKTPSPPPRHHYHRYQRPLIPLSVSLAKTVTCIRTRDSHSYSSSILNEQIFHFDFSSSLVAHCITSASSAEPQVVVDWNDAVSCSEVGDGANGSLEEEEEDPRTNIPVKAYFFSTSVDLRGLVDQNRQNFIPPTSRMTNYVVLKFGTLSNPSGLLSSLSQGTGASISGSDCCFMVVFQYGSIVLFNVSEPE
ncbi:hypothetical protein CISIN_1g0164742mg, partial [Citrus sinensis]